MELNKAFQQITEDFISLLDSLDENELNTKHKADDWSP